MLKLLIMCILYLYFRDWFKTKVFMLSFNEIWFIEEDLLYDYFLWYMNSKFNIGIFGVS